MKKYINLANSIRFIDKVYRTFSSLLQNADEYGLTPSQQKQLAIAKDKLYDVKIIVENVAKEFRG